MFLPAAAESAKSWNVNGALGSKPKPAWDNEKKRQVNLKRGTEMKTCQMTICQKTRTGFLALIGAFPLASQAGAAVLFYDDFATNSLSNYTNPSGTDAATKRTAFTYDGANHWVNGGTSGTAPANYASMAYNTTIGDLAALGSVTLSIDFLTGTDATNNASAASNATVGFSSDAAKWSDVYNGFDANVRGNGGTAGDAQIRIRVDDVAGSGDSAELYSPVFDVLASTWYTLSLTVAKTATTNRFNVSAQLTLQSNATVIASIAATERLNADCGSDSGEAGALAGRRPGLSG